MNITTSDQHTYTKKSVETISARFKLIEDYISTHPEEKCIPLSIDKRSFDLVNAFTKTLLEPTSKEDWYTLLYAADYLNLTPRYHAILFDLAYNYAILRGACIVAPKPSLGHIAEKIKDPRYKAAGESKCIYTFTRGQRQGEQCNAPNVVNSDYCASCSLKKSVAKTKPSCKFCGAPAVLSIDSVHYCSSCHLEGNLSQEDNPAVQIAALLQ